MFGKDVPLEEQQEDFYEIGTAGEDIGALNPLRFWPHSS